MGICQTVETIFTMSAGILYGYSVFIRYNRVGHSRKLVLNKGLRIKANSYLSFGKDNVNSILILSFLFLSTIKYP